MSDLAFVIGVGLIGLLVFLCLVYGAYQESERDRRIREDRP